MEEIYYQNSFSTAQVPVFQAINFSEFLIQFAKSYKEKLNLEDPIFSAMNWMNAETNYDETRLFNVMTALECLVENKITRVIEKPEFKKLRTSFKELLNNSNFSTDEKNHFSSYLDNSNRKPFKYGLLELIANYDIGCEKLSNEYISDLVKVRNDLVHTGETKKQDELFHYYLLAREIIVRIFLKTIDYSGPRLNHLN